jgi:hypothetical protein
VEEPFVPDCLCRDQLFIKSHCCVVCTAPRLSRIAMGPLLQNGFAAHRGCADGGDGDSFLHKSDSVEIDDEILFT